MAPRWEADGWDATVRIGLLVPHGDVGPESEIGAMAPPGVRIHATRVPFGAMRSGGGMDPTISLEPVRRFAEPPELDDAAELLAAAPLHVIAYAFTSSAYVIGAGAEGEMVRRLEQRTRGIRVVTPCAAAVEALHALHIRSIASFDPPWFDAELVGLGKAYYEAAGFDVIHAGPCGLPSDQAAIAPDALHRWIVRHVPADADAIVVGGNGFRAVGAIAAIEAALDRPVLTANQVLLWSALRAADATLRLDRYGRIFEIDAGASSEPAPLPQADALRRVRRAGGPSPHMAQRPSARDDVH
jgi:maleate isomerase